MNIKDRLVDPRSPDRRPRRAAYALPTLFTSANVFLGFVAIVQVFQGAIQASTGAYGANVHFALAAKLIGFAVLFDGLDGRIARMTNTVSDFGRELDSLADVITFGIAPAFLAYAWGVHFVLPPTDLIQHERLLLSGCFICFVFLLGGAMRLARFNITTNPIPKNPGRPDRKYFVGLAIPAAAGMVASVVYMADGAPLRWWPLVVLWLALMAMLSVLMVSTWRYPSFKDINLLQPRSPLSFIFLATLIYLIWVASQPVLLVMSIAYVGSGIVIRVGGAIRRRLRPSPPAPQPEHQVG